MFQPVEDLLLVLEDPVVADILWEGLPLDDYILRLDLIHVKILLLPTLGLDLILPLVEETFLHWKRFYFKNKYECVSKMIIKFFR